MPARRASARLAGVVGQLVTCSRKENNRMAANHFLRLLFAAAIALLALAPASAALAVPPTQVTVYVDDTFEDPALTGKCGFPVQIHLEGTVKFITRFDQAGQPVREFQAFPNFRVTFSA